MLRQFSGPATMVCIGGGEIATQLRRTVELISTIFRCVRIAERTFSPAAFLRWLGVASDARFCADSPRRAGDIQSSPISRRSRAREQREVCRSRDVGFMSDFHQQRTSPANSPCPKSAKGGSGGCKSRKEKAARRRLFNFRPMIADQAAINAGFDFRRYAMKPRPAKPRIIIAHVEGSGTELPIEQSEPQESL
jgi:hypothetical protein